MKIVPCQYCAANDLPCADLQFNELPEGRFKKEMIPEMIEALEAYLEALDYIIADTYYRPKKKILKAEDPYK